MIPDPTKSEPPFTIDVPHWLGVHPNIAIAFGSFCLWVSLCLIIRLWLIHPGSDVKKVYWSVILLIPLVGWTLYAGCYEIPSSSGRENSGVPAVSSGFWPTG